MEGRPERRQHYDTLEQALAGIAPSPERQRSPFMPVRRGAPTSTTPSSPLASKHSSSITPSAGPLAPLTLNNLSRLPPHEYDDYVEASPSLRAKASVGTGLGRSYAPPPLPATPSAPIQVRAKITPSANVRRKVHLPGAERADPAPAPRARSRSAAAPKALILNQTPLSSSTLPAYDDGPRYIEPEEDYHVASSAGKDSVLVCVRIRPAAPTGHSALTAQQQRAVAHQTHDEAWIADEDNATVAPMAGGPLDFRFDAVVTGTGNQAVYAKAARSLVLSSMEGFDACVFAYGQTASGKTFTLTGTPANPGIIPQAVTDVFAYIRSHPNKEFLLRASFLEIYNESLKDLLSPETEGQVKIRQDAEKRFFVSPLHEEIVTCEAQVAELLRRGDINRHTAGTDFNARSSRSHTVFQMVIESRDAPSTPNGRPPSRGYGLRKGAAMLDDGSGEAVRMSRLSLVDLAGSEKATSQTERRMEGSFINRSLLTLEKVIAALTEDKPRAHIPYRDSKLTQLLQPSLCGEARVAVICTVNPSVTAVDESKSTLKFATRVKKVTLHAEKREIVDDKALITKYRSTIAELQAQLAAKDAEFAAGVPPTPRSDDDAARAAREAKAREREREVESLKKQIQNFQLLMINSTNVDDKREDLPRAVSPTKLQITESADNLHDQLMDARDKLAEKEDELMRLTEALTACQLDRDSRPVVSPDAPPTEKDQALAELDKEVRELRCILGDTDRDYNAAIRMARRTAAREWQLKCEALEGQLEAQKALHEDALAQVAVERKKAAQLEQYILQHLAGSAERLARPRVSSISETSPSASRRPRRSYSLGGEGDFLPQLADEEPDLEVVSTQFANVHVDIDAMGRSSTMLFDFDRRDRERTPTRRMR